MMHRKLGCNLLVVGDAHRIGALGKGLNRFGSLDLTFVDNFKIADYAHSCRWRNQSQRVERALVAVGVDNFDKRFFAHPPTIQIHAENHGAARLFELQQADDLEYRRTGQVVNHCAVFNRPNLCVFFSIHLYKFNRYDIIAMRV